MQAEELHRLREENQALRDEVARLKGQKGKAVDRPVAPDPQGPEGQPWEAMSPG
jgi:hypothetical protein